MAVDVVRLGKRRASTPRQPHGIVGCLEIFGNDGKLVAAKTPDKVRLAHGLLEPRRHLGKESVAGGVAERAR